MCRAQDMNPLGVCVDNRIPQSTERILHRQTQRLFKDRRLKATEHDRTFSVRLNDDYRQFLDLPRFAFDPSRSNELIHAGQCWERSLVTLMKQRAHTKTTASSSSQKQQLCKIAGRDWSRGITLIPVCYAEMRSGCG